MTRPMAAGRAASPARAWAARPPRATRGRGFLTAVLILAVVLAAILAVVKFAAVRWRYLRRGPRQQASAAYHELSTFLGDQGVVPVSSRTFEDLSHEINRWYAVDASDFAASASRARYGPAAEPAKRRARCARRCAG